MNCFGDCNCLIWILILLCGCGGSGFGCGEGRMVEKSTKRGKLFYSCDRYPQCDFALWDKPVPGPCPRCNSSYLVEKRGRDGSVKIMCPTKGCGYVKGGDDGQDA